MKNYDETISAVFERMDEFEKIKVRKRKLAIKTLIPLTCLCLATLIGVSVWQTQTVKPTPTANSSANNSTEPTSSQNKKVIYVTGDTPDQSIADGSSIKSLKNKYISTALREKMDLYKDYKDAEVRYCVVIGIFIAQEDYNKANELADADKEVQYLFEQVAIVSSEEIKAREEYNVFKGLNKGNDPETVQKRNELMAIRDEKEKRKKELWSQWSNLRSEIGDKYCMQVRAERLEFLKQFSENELETTLYGGDTQNIIALTAEEINILAEKGGYTFRLSNEKPPVAANN